MPSSTAPSPATGPFRLFTDLDRKILHVGLPAMGGFLGLILFDLANIFWVGRLGPQAVAGVAASGFVMWSLYALMNVTTSGCGALVAQRYGAKALGEAHEVIATGFWLSLGLAVAAVAGLWPYIAHPFTWMGLDGPTAAHALSYFRVVLAFYPVAFLYTLTGNVFNAYGDTRTSTLIMIAALGVNMVLDPILMFGWVGLPALGVQGAAIATAVSQTLGLVGRIWALRQKDMISPWRGFVVFPRRWVGATLRIGIPNALTSCVWSVVYPFLTRIITPFGMAPLSALGVCHRLESFPYFGGIGMGIALTALIGQARGRGDHEEIRALASRGLWLTSGLMAPFVAAFLLAPRHLVSLLTDDAATIEHGASYLWAIGVTEVLLGWELALTGAFTGLGRTAPTLAITLPLTVGRVPLAWFLSEKIGFGLPGVWWAISLSTAGKGLGLALLWWWFMRSDGSMHGRPLPETSVGVFPRA